MVYDHYAEAKGIAAELEKAEFTAAATNIRQAIAEGVSGTEIFMQLRFYLRPFVDAPGVSDETKARMRELYAKLDLGLSTGEPAMFVVGPDFSPPQRQVPVTRIAGEAWTRILDTTFLRMLYKDYPEMDPIQLHQFVLLPAGPELNLTINIFDLPADPPPKWGPINRVQIEFSFSELTRISLTKFSRLNMCSMDLDYSNGFIASVRGDSILDFHATHCRIRKITGFWRR